MIETPRVTLATMRPARYWLEDACPAEVLDIARALWLTGGVWALSIRENYISREGIWTWMSRDAYDHEQSKGGHSANETR